MIGSFLFGETLKPKHHLMLHYPRIMRTVGPLRSLWSMRFEGKHRPLKQYAHAITSRVNLSYSIAVKQQLTLCDLFSKMQSGHLRYITYKKSTLISHNTSVLNNYTNYIALRNVSFGNITLKKGSIVLLSIDNDSPIFAEIIEIFMNNSVVYNNLSISDFVGIFRYLYTNYYDGHYQAYCMNISDVQCC